MPKSHNLPLNRFAQGDRPLHPGELQAEGLADGIVRRVAITRVWGGKGCGAPCDFCGVLVTASDIEYELEAELDGVPVTLHFHPRCHEAWRAERLPGADLPTPRPHRLNRRHDRS